MGLRLSAMASVARSLVERADTCGEFPGPDDVLEPAIDLLNESLSSAQRLADARRAAFARSRLADAYLQSRQFAKAHDETSRTACDSLPCKEPFEARCASLTEVVGTTCVIERQRTAPEPPKQRYHLRYHLRYQTLLFACPKARNDKGLPKKAFVFN